MMSKDLNYRKQVAGSSLMRQVISTIFDPEILQIGPEIAQAILGGHDNFRNVSNATVALYSRLMESGRWYKSILLFNNDGELVDGQHRLHAIIKSGTVQPFVLLGGFNEVMAIDDNYKRTRSQCILNELPQEKNITRKSSIASCLHKLEIGTCGRRSNIEHFGFYNRYAGVINAIACASDPSAKFPGGASCAAAFCRAAIAFPERAEEIIECSRKFLNYEFREENDEGIRLLVKYLDRRGSVTGRASKDELYNKASFVILNYLFKKNTNKLSKAKRDAFAGFCTPEQIEYSIDFFNNKMGRSL